MQDLPVSLKTIQMHASVVMPGQKNPFLKSCNSFVIFGSAAFLSGIAANDTFLFLLGVTNMCWI